MNKANKVGVVGMAAAMSLISFFSHVQAQTTNTNQAALQQGSANSQQLVSAERADQILRKNIQNQKGQTIGKLNNFIVDLESGHVLYGIVNVSDLPGGNQV